MINDDQLVESEDPGWCNCQAIPGTVNYPGPWHPEGDQPFYPCSQASNVPLDRDD